MTSPASWPGATPGHARGSGTKIEGKKVRKVSQTDAGGLAEGIAFSADGDYLYVGNFLDGDVTILRGRGDRLVKAGMLKLPGHPASMRASTP
jgi:DNA-binding beta-propeller fold protein YncE